MPGTFKGLGVHFLYPENWTISEQVEPGKATAGGVTLETPQGAFFSLNRYPGLTDPQQVVDEAISAMRDEYDNLEIEPCGALANQPEIAGVLDPDSEAGADLSFYVLDLLITARLLTIVHQGDALLVQIQGESRDFETLEPVFAAMLKSLRDSLAD